MTFLWVPGQFALGTGTATPAQGPPGKLCVCIQCLEWEWFGDNLWTEVQGHPGGGHLEEVTEVTATTLEMHSCETLHRHSRFISSVFWQAEHLWMYLG